MGAVWQLVVISSVIGAGIGLAYGAMTSLVMAAVPASKTASANSLNTLMRSIGTSLSSAVAGLVLAQLTTQLGGVSIPAQSAFQVVMGVGAGRGPRSTRRRSLPAESSCSRIESRYREMVRDHRFVRDHGGKIGPRSMAMWRVSALTVLPPYSSRGGSAAWLVPANRSG
jgi:MFS family permease